MDEGEAVCTNMDEDMQKDNVAAFAGSKPHYELLDGLRGVAALMVMWFHVFEAFATSPVDQRVNHGYMAVDFFFILSGFVIGYAYDDRWGKGMTVKGFFRRRLIRLHPMVIVGAVLGAVAFCVQGCEKWDGTAVPHVGGEGRLWLNGIYDTVCVLLFFPLLVYMGASGKATDPVTSKVCKFLGDISYPLYIVHYPFMYLYYSWVWKNGLTFRESLPGVAAVFVVSILLAYLFLKVYDEPVRRWLTARSGRKRQVGA